MEDKPKTIRNKILQPTLCRGKYADPLTSRAGSGAETATRTMTVWAPWSVVTTTATTPSAGSAISRTAVSTHRLYFSAY